MQQATDGRELEQALIGAALDGEAVLRLLEPQHLHECHRAVWRALLTVADRGEALDYVTVGRELRASGQLWKGTRQQGTAYLIGCAIAWDDLPREARSAEAIAEMVLERHEAREQERALLKQLRDLREGRRPGCGIPTTDVVPYRRRPRG